MQVKARLRNHRGSAQKARLLADQVRGKGVEAALSLLSLSTKRFARPLAKLLRSALANAEDKNNRNRAGIDIDSLIVSAIEVGRGSSAWRVMPRAQGRANWIQHRTSHVTVVLDER